MTFPIIVEMLGHPRGKGRPRSFRAKSGAILVHTDQKTEEYEGNLRVAAKQAMAGRPLLEMPLRVLVEADFPIAASWSGKRRREALLGILRPCVSPDWDNIAKVCDAANKLIWNDDRQIVEGAVIKRYSDRPLLRITVWPAVEATPALSPRAAADDSADLSFRGRGMSATIAAQPSYIADIRERLAFYEGGGMHSAAAKNRNRKRDEGPLFDRPYDEHAGALGSYNDAVRVIGEQVKAGGEVTPFLRSTREAAGD
jgi:Holliday junction resolvase RusA-like endonuclease